MPYSPRRDNASAVGEAPAALRRRKVRKGAQSCWECKRRKVRCTFAAPTDAVCDGCRSRRTRCISQRFHDEPASAGTKTDRLSRVESLVEQLVSRGSVDTSSAWPRRRPSPDENPAPPSRDSSGGRRDADVEQPPSLVVTTPGPDLTIEGQLASNPDHLSRALFSIWPDERDLDLILSIPVGVSVLFHGMVCQPHSELFSRGISSRRRILQPPSLESHPVLLARKLLLLATLLQGIPPCYVDELSGLSAGYRAIMYRTFNAATRLVTSNDELVSSLEGIECVMIESMYLNNAGDLRRAWLANRRAMVTAQMMGLHAGAPGRALESETRDRIDPAYMWFRLVVSDRYLSLILGLPQGSSDNPLANQEALHPDDSTAMEHMERMMSVAAGLILQRNEIERINLAATYKVDEMLQKAAALMPPRWWLTTPDLAAISGDDARAFEESIRLANQFAYHHLLVQLHLPYLMLSPSAEPNYDYSKMTAANASRAIVTQFVSFRSSILSTAYCRGIDFISFIASTTLCLAHIEARRQHRSDANKSAAAFQSLRHQRFSDRGLLEHTLQIMETMAQTSCDAVAQKISDILRPLLAIENESFGGGYYHIQACSGVDKQQEPQSLGDAGYALHPLRIQIPHLGSIHIEHRPALPETVEPARIFAENEPSERPRPQKTGASLVVLRDPASPINQDGGWIVTSTARPASHGTNTAQPVNADWQTAPSYLDQTETLEQPEPANKDPIMSPPFDSSEAREARYFLEPDVTADTVDWTLQGVDLALFSTLAQAWTDSAHDLGRDP
ncbi:hypothetical protein GGS23DRAFT_158776 [Durotheca rogersii]|uniref:uncharacterized protein n=1 Tax=Durotheca rogersii TaxID=419775 RepID=UPI00221EDA62|nr:uncharacterized protein GGS23DRAFT_158776 [Durotheca rogersii]KAI5861227.1 hypothetical protein GGS23DRAFT_158776 [Durotheca rogersii]